MKIVVAAIMNWLDIDSYELGDTHWMVNQNNDTGMIVKLQCVACDVMLGDIHQYSKGQEGNIINWSIFPSPVVEQHCQ